MGKDTYSFDRQFSAGGAVCANASIPTKSSSFGHFEPHKALACGYIPHEDTPLPPCLDPPPFTLKDIRAAIPAHCFERSLIHSLWHLFVNIVEVIGIFSIGYYTSRCIETWPLLIQIPLWMTYWFVQGSYLTGCWVMAHECGHQAFSPYKWVNDTVGLLIHSLLLVPYHSWRISHRLHHSYTSSIENDEVFVPQLASSYAKTYNWTLAHSTLYRLYGICYMLLLGWPGYLLFNATGPAKYNMQSKSHFNPYAAIFTSRERSGVALSVFAWCLAVGVLFYSIHLFGFAMVAFHYLVPYLIAHAYLVTITYLHHTDTYVPRLRETKWNFVWGALCTVDRSFGKWLDGVLHHISDTHVCHHLFSTMPFYHCVEATPYLEKFLGPYYLKDPTSIPKALWRAYSECQYVEDKGDIVFLKGHFARENKKNA